MNWRVIIFLFYSHKTASSSAKFTANSIPINKFSINDITCHVHLILEKEVFFELFLTTPHTIYTSDKHPNMISLSKIKGLACIFLLLTLPNSKMIRNYFLRDRLEWYGNGFVGFPHLTTDWRLNDYYIHPRLAPQTFVLILSAVPFKLVSRYFIQSVNTLSEYKNL